MAKRKAGDIVISKDRLRQIRVVREDEVAAPAKAPKHHKRYATGDMLDTTYKPRFFDIIRPCKALEVRENTSMASGFSVRVATTIGEQELDSWHFSKSKPEPAGS